MKDIFVLIMGYIPAYVPELARVLCAPRAFLTEPTQLERDQIRASFVFFGISVVLGELASFATRSGLGRTFVADAVATVVESGVILLFVAAISTGAWRVVGGHLRFERALFIANYTLGTALLLESLCIVVVVGFAKLFVPEFETVFGMLMSGKQAAALAPMVQAAAAAHPLTVFTFSSLMLSATVALLAWIVWATVRTFRALDPLSAPRSLLAVAIWLICAIAVVPFMIFFSLAV